MDAQPMPLGPDNPHGVGFDITERLLRSEAEAQRDAAPERSRVWKASREEGAERVGVGARMQQSCGCGVSATQSDTLVPCLHPLW